MINNFESEHNYITKYLELKPVIILLIYVLGIWIQIRILPKNGADPQHCLLYNFSIQYIYDSDLVWRMQLMIIKG